MHATRRSLCRGRRTSNSIAVTFSKSRHRSWWQRRQQWRVGGCEVTTCNFSTERASHLMSFVCFDVNARAHANGHVRVMIHARQCVYRDDPSLRPVFNSSSSFVPSGKASEPHYPVAMATASSSSWACPACTFVNVRTSVTHPFHISSSACTLNTNAYMTCASVCRQRSVQNMFECSSVIVTLAAHSAYTGQLRVRRCIFV